MELTARRGYVLAVNPLRIALLNGGQAVSSQIAAPYTTLLGWHGFVIGDEWRPDR